MTQPKTPNHLASSNTQCGNICGNTKTCSNDSPDNRIWRKGLATLNPLNWHFFRLATTFSNTLHLHMTKKQRDWSEPTTIT